MTKDQAINFREKYLKLGARDFTKPSHFELPDLLEIHIDVIEVLATDFHDLQGGVKYPRKETIDRFASAAGVSFRDLPPLEKHVRGEPFVGRSQGVTMGPDGQPVMGDIAEYEFDPTLRAEEDFIKKPDNFKTEGQKRLKVLEYEKVGRQRANTGARSRATLSVLGIQTGFKDFKPPKEFFLFSRVIVNTKNKMMAQAMIASMSGNAKMLFGPSTATERTIEAEARTMEPGEDFDPGTDDNAQGPDVNPFRANMAELVAKYGNDLGETAVIFYKDMLGKSETTDEQFAAQLAKVTAWLKSQKGIDVKLSGVVQ